MKDDALILVSKLKMVLHEVSYSGKDDDNRNLGRSVCFGVACLCVCFCQFLIPAIVNLVCIVSSLSCCTFGLELYCYIDKHMLLL